MERDAPWLPPGHCIVPGPKVLTGRPDRHPQNPTSRQLPSGLWCSQNPPSSPSPSPYGRSLSRRRSAPPLHSSAQYGVIAPFTSTHASTRRGMEVMSRVSQYHRCVRPREQEACTNTSENWRGTCFEHHWPNELLTAARSTAPGRACWGEPYFMGFHENPMGFSLKPRGVFMGFSWGRPWKPEMLCF